MTGRVFRRDKWRGDGGAVMLVTGGTGFLGKHVVAALESASEGLEVLCPRHCLSGWDLWNYNSIDAMIDYAVVHQDPIIHLAASCGGIQRNEIYGLDMMLENVVMGGNILYAVTRNAYQYEGEDFAVRFINVGTTCSYPADCGEAAKETQLYDGEPDEANRPYGLAKRWICRAVDEVNGRLEWFNGANLILANLYGPGDNYCRDESHVVPGMIAAFVQGLKTGEVVLWGNGDVKREFLYVEDAAKAIAIAACSERPFKGTFNVGSGEIVTMRELAAMIQQIVGYDGPVEWDHGQPSGQKTRGLDSLKWIRASHKATPWIAKVKLEDGLRATVADYMTWKARMDRLTNAS